jgi:predicted kinase
MLEDEWCFLMSYSFHNKFQFQNAIDPDDERTKRNRLIGLAAGFSAIVGLILLLMCLWCCCCRGNTDKKWVPNVVLGMQIRSTVDTVDSPDFEKEGTEEKKKKKKKSKDSESGV